MRAIDNSHCDLIYGLVRAFKPKRVLEFGYGEGKSASAIYRACTANDAPGGWYQFRYTIIDNWLDFEGKPPSILENLVITADEEEFVNTTDQKFDFILCDGDHKKTDQYWRKIYDDLLNSPGIACFHDVSNPDYPNLRKIGEGIPSSLLFKTNSGPGERCDRGLLVLFK